MKVIIIGSSIAGSAMALALSDYAEVSVYESKKEEDISKKTCGNVCTYSLEQYAHGLGLEEDFILSRYHKLKIFSRKNTAEFPTREYEIDRKKLLREMIQKARRNSAEFHFGTRFLEFTEKNGKFKVLLENSRRKFSEEADVLIGADGALSEVAKSAGLFGRRKFFLFLQARVSDKEIGAKNLIPEKNSYHVFLGKNYGHYAYIFPSKDGKEFKIGLGDDCEKDVQVMFRLFMEKLGVNWRRKKIEGALIPKPRACGGRRNLFLVGDASGNVKYSGGGIVPDLEQAIALRDAIISKNFSKLRRQRGKIAMNQRATRLLQRMKDDDFDNLLGALKSEKFRQIFSSRDELSKKDVLKMLSPRLMWLGLKLMLRR